MFEVTISVSELYSLAKEMLNEGMDYVTIRLEEPDTEPGLESPAFVTFDASTKSNPYGDINYGEIYAVQFSD